MMSSHQTSSENRILEELGEIKAQIEVIKITYPQIQGDLNNISEKISVMSERITRVETETESAHEKIESFKKAVLWTISVSVTACGTLVGVISFIIQHLLNK